MMDVEMNKKELVMSIVAKQDEQFRSSDSE